MKLFEDILRQIYSAVPLFKVSTDITLSDIESLIKQASGLIARWHDNEWDKRIFLISIKGENDPIIQKVTDALDTEAVIYETQTNETMFAVLIDLLRYPIQEFRELPKGTVLYHGSKTGNLKIDYDRENGIYFTEDKQMALDYALLKDSDFGAQLVKLTARNREQRKVIKVLTRRDLMLAVSAIGDTTVKRRPIGFRDMLYKSLLENGFDGLQERENGYFCSSWGNNSTGRDTICEGDSIYLFDLHDIVVIR